MILSPFLKDDSGRPFVSKVCSIASGVAILLVRTEKLSTSLTTLEAETMNSTKPRREVLPPHKVPADADAYLAACSPDERRLVELAVERLGSSYFMEKSHGYLAWKAKQNGAKPK